MILKVNGKEIATDVDYAHSPFSQAIGLMFRRKIDEDYALIFVMKKAKRLSLHMLFVNFPIGAVFLDDNKRVIKISRLKPWIGICSCSEKAKYVVEMSHGKIDLMNIEIGDLFDF